MKDLNSEALLSTTSITNTFDVETGALTSEITTVVEASSANGGQSGVTHRSETHHTLFNDFPNSCFGRPETTTLTKSHTSPSGLAVTQTSRTIWDGVHCRPQRAMIEPGDPLWQVTTDFIYDDFGNSDLITVTPAANQGQSARITDLGWDATGRFLESVTNPEGEVTRFGWNASLGVRSSMTDANNLLTDLTLDAFGRVTRESRPDGTATDYVLELCSTSACQTGDAWIRTQITAIRRDTSNIEVSRAIVWLDMFDRETRSQSMVQSGTTTPNLRVMRQTFNNLGLPYQGQHALPQWRYGVLHDVYIRRIGQADAGAA